MAVDPPRAHGADECESQMSAQRHCGAERSDQGGAVRCSQATLPRRVAPIGQLWLLVGVVVLASCGIYIIRSCSTARKRILHP